MKNLSLFEPQIEKHYKEKHILSNYGSDLINPFTTKGPGSDKEGKTKLQILLEILF